MVTAFANNPRGCPDSYQEDPLRGASPVARVGPNGTFQGRGNSTKPQLNSAGQMDNDLASRQQARALLAETRRAYLKMRSFSQEKIDHICVAAMQAGLQASGRLAQVAVEETGFGTVEGKTAKNEFASFLAFCRLRHNSVPSALTIFRPSLSWTRSR